MVVGVALLLARPLFAAEPGTAEPLRVHGVSAVMELGPLLRAAELMPEGSVVVRPGNVLNLWRDEAAGPAEEAGESYGTLRAPSFPGRADVAGNAETQALRQSLEHPDVRIVMTVTEGLYRIVGRRSAGIAKMDDLRGKRIATMPATSAAYFLHRMLRTAGLTEADVTVVPLQATEAADRLIAGEVDAIAFWEPEVERAHRVLGNDAIEIKGEGVYRELYNLNTTAGALADPARRAAILAYMKALRTACREAVMDPARTVALVAESSGFDAALVGASWHHHRFGCDLPPDVLDIMADEEQWLAAQEGRRPRSREELAGFIDDSLLRELEAQ